MAEKDKLRPGRKALDAAYKAASRERWRIELAKEWAATEGEAWPDGPDRGAATSTG